MARFDLRYFEKKLIALWAQLSRDHTLCLQWERGFLARADHQIQVRQFAQCILDRDPGLCAYVSSFPPLVQLKGLDEGLYVASHNRVGMHAEPSIHEMDGKPWILQPRKAVRPASHHLGQPGVRHLHLRYHRIFQQFINGYEIKIEPLRGATKRGLETLTPRGLRCFLHSSQELDEPLWDPGSLKNGQFVANTVTNPEDLWREIEKALTQAKAEDANLFVLPELTVPPDLRDRIGQWLENGGHPFLLVLPGSFHETDPVTGERFNTALLLNRWGEEILHHRKLIPFGSEKEGREEIQPGRRITLLDTPAGLFAVAICRDFCEENDPFPRIWEELQPDWVLVPSMTGKSGISAHVRAAEKLMRCGSSRVMVVNAWRDSDPPQGELVYPCGFLADGRIPGKNPITGFFCGSLPFD